MEKKRAIALGFFDGVHLGHQALLQKVVERAQERNLRPTVFAFADCVGLPGKSAPPLTTQAQRERLICSLFPIEEVITVPLDERLRSTDWQDFLQMLVEGYHAEWLVVGYDFRFGRDRMGDTIRLAQWAAQHGIGCDVVEQVAVDGKGVHTAEIRRLLERGEKKTAERLLGYPLSVLSEK